MRSFLFAVLVLSWIAAAPARADTTASPAAATAPAPSASAATSPAGDFDLFGSEPAVKVTPAFADPQLAERAAERRNKLQLHQVMGLTTLGLMTATSVVGNLAYNDMYSKKGSGSDRFLWPKRLLAYSTTAAFGTTAYLSLSAPESYEKHGGIDTATIHKVAVTGATAGMLTQVALGFLMSRRADAGNQRNLQEMARYHVITGWATTGLMAVAASVWVF